MGDQPSIRYLAHNDINRDQWDNCIRQAENGLIYGYSWYLDTTAGNWDGLVSGDYEAVMPLPLKKKIFYPVYLPAFSYRSTGCIWKKGYKGAGRKLFEPDPGTVQAFRISPELQECLFTSRAWVLCADELRP